MTKLSKFVYFLIFEERVGAARLVVQAQEKYFGGVSVRSA